MKPAPTSNAKTSKPAPSAPTSKPETAAPVAPASKPEAPTAAPTATEPGKATPQAGADAARRKAANTLRVVAKRLGRHDFAALGVDVAPVLATLATVSAAMGVSAPKPKAPKLAPGAVVRLRSKAAARFDGIILPTDTITVVALAKGGIRGELADGSKVLLPRAAVELA